MVTVAAPHTHSHTHSINCLHNIYSLNYMSQIKNQISQLNSSAPVASATGGSTRLGYSFPCQVTSNKFFNEFIAGFKRSGAESFTQLQCSMLDELLHNRAFQVTSPDVSCGSGKTSLTVAATIGLFNDNDKIVFVNKPGRGESSLTKELKQLVERYSGGPSMMTVSTILNGSDAGSLVPESDVIITNTIALDSVLRAVVDNALVLSQSTVTTGKVYIIFDEAHKIFNHEGLSKMAAWTLEQEKICSTSTTVLESLSKPALSSVADALIQLQRSSVQHGCLTTVPIFLSAVGDFSTSNVKNDSEKKLSSSEVVDLCVGQWLNTTVTKLVNSGNNSERSYNNIFKIHREGAAQIGGVDASGYVMVYEAMFKIAFTRLIKGRMLFIVRRQQVDTFSSLLDAKIKESGSFFSYTTDREYWNAIDQETLKPLYNIVIVREDELDDLEGVNIEGLRAVYLFSLGKTQNLYQKMQGLGRVGRLGQEASYCFVMIDCATKRNGAVEAESAPFLLDALNSNGTARPHIIEVKGAKALDVQSNIPIYTPNLMAPTPMQLQDLQKDIRKANRPQVCKFMRYSPKSRTYECPSIQKGYKCAWYHPRPTDFISRSTTLKCCRFNISYCRKGVFREANCCCVNSMLPIAPVTASTMAWTTNNPVQMTVLSTHFPKLGEEQVPQKATALVDPCSHGIGNTIAAVNPRLERPVCRFAAMDMYKCKTRRTGKLCFFRHPEEAEDCVTDDEYMEALRLSIQNLNKTKAKYGQKPIVFSPDLYSKYNYPGRFKSHLAKPVVVKASPPVSKSLATVLTDEFNDSESSPLFSAVQTAYCIKTAVVAEVKEVTDVPSVSVVAGTSTKDDGVATCEVAFTSVVRNRKMSSSKRSSPEDSLSSVAKTSGCNYFQLLSGDATIEDEEEVDTNENEADASSTQSPECIVAEAEQKRKQMEAKVAEEKADKVMEQEKALRKAQAVAAGALVSSELHGADLVARLVMTSKESSSSTTAAALVTAFLSGQTATALKYHLFSDEKYGLAVKHLLEEEASTKVTAQVRLLEAVEMFCHEQGFVKVDVKSGQKYLIDVLFRLMYAYELVEEDAFFEWYESSAGDSAGTDSSARAEVKLKAVMQSTDFFGWLLQDAEESDCDNGEELSCANYGQTQPDTQPVTLVVEEEKQEEHLSKAERKALKQQRRQERVADRGDDGNSKLAYRQLSSASSMECRWSASRGVCQ